MTKLLIPDEYDRRQLRTMLDMLSIDDYEPETLIALANSLISLRDLLHWHDGDWRHQCTEHIVTLDSCALASPEQIRTMGSRYQEVIKEAIESLQKLMSDALAL